MKENFPKAAKLLTPLSLSSLITRIEIAYFFHPFFHKEKNKFPNNVRAVSPGSPESTHPGFILCPLYIPALLLCIQIAIPLINFYQHSWHFNLQGNCCPKSEVFASISDFYCELFNMKENFPTAAKLVILLALKALITQIYSAWLQDAYFFLHPYTWKTSFWAYWASSIVLGRKCPI